MAAEVNRLNHELSEQSEAFVRVEQALADALKSGETLEIEKKDLDLRMSDLQETVETLEHELESAKQRTLDARETAKEAISQVFHWLHACGIHICVCSLIPSSLWQIFRNSLKRPRANFRPKRR